jgi:hypothetical protein
MPWCCDWPTWSQVVGAHANTVRLSIDLQVPLVHGVHVCAHDHSCDTGRRPSATALPITSTHFLLFHSFPCGGPGPQILPAGRQVEHVTGTSAGARTHGANLCYTKPYSLSGVCVAPWKGKLICRQAVEGSHEGTERPLHENT